MSMGEIRRKPRPGAAPWPALLAAALCAAAHLERPDREAWQRPGAVIAALGLRGAERVADLGAGSGYFT